MMRGLNVSFAKLRPNRGALNCNSLFAQQTAVLAAAPMHVKTRDWNVTMIAAWSRKLNDQGAVIEMANRIVMKK